MDKTYQFYGVPDYKTEKNLFKLLGNCGILHTRALEQRIKYHGCASKSIIYNEQVNEFAPLGESLGLSLFMVKKILTKVELEWNNFLKKTRFKKPPIVFPSVTRQHNWISISKESYDIKGKNLFLEGLGKIKLFISRAIPDTVKALNIKYSQSGKWFVAFVCEEEVKSNPPVTSNNIKIFPGSHKSIRDSNYKLTYVPKLDKEFDLLQNRKDKLLKMELNSNNYKKQQCLIAKQYNRIQSIKRDFYHKLSTYYVTKYDKITLTTGNRFDGVSWGVFYPMLRYKCQENNRCFKKIKRR